MKNTYKIYLEEGDYRKLLAKAKEIGLEGRGATSHYIEKICKEPVVFLDNNARQVLKLIGLK